jgi:hypothetical protein
MTDHRNLVYIYKATAPKVVRWKLRLQTFDFDIVHIPGTANAVADSLSRLFTIQAQPRVEPHTGWRQPHPKKCLQIMHNCKNTRKTSQEKVDMGEYE